jgi:hypothetical protein
MQRVTFHTFRMGDVEDPEIYAAQPIWEWQQTEMGKWVMIHCPDPRYSVEPDHRNWGHLIRLYGELEDTDATFFQLRWSKIENS